MNYFKKSIFWLYSSSYSNTWWGYNDECCDKLNLIYNDYIKRTTIDTNTYLTVNSYDNKIANNTIPMPNNNPTTFDSVDYSDIDNIEQPLNSNLVDYMITVDNNKFYINLDHMEQINYLNKNKKRKILRVEILDKNENDKLLYLTEQYKFRGISGNAIQKNEIIKE